MTTTDKPPHTVKVDGEEFHMEHRYVTSLDILERAKDKAILADDPRNYLLKSLTTDDKLYTSLEEQVDLEEDNIFTALPNTSTPVG